LLLAFFACVDENHTGLIRPLTYQFILSVFSRYSIPRNVMSSAASSVIIAAAMSHLFPGRVSSLLSQRPLFRLLQTARNTTPTNQHN